MKTKYLTILFASAITARAQIPVTDFAHIVTSQTNWVSELGQWVESAANQTQQIANQVEQIQQFATQLERAGDPAALIQSLGITELEQITELTKAAKSYQEFGESALEDPLGTLSRTGGGKVSAAPSTLYGGGAANYNEDNFRKYAVHGEIADDYRERSGQLAQARKNIQTELDRTAHDLDNATTEAEVARLQGRAAILQGQQEQLSREELIGAAQSTVEVNDFTMTRNAKGEAQAHAFAEERRAAIERNSSLTVPDAVRKTPFTANPSNQ